MKLFGRRKKEEDDVESKEPKDLERPKRIRKKKEEPPKPWGRSERYLVLGVLGVTVIGAAFLALSAREWKLPGLPRLGLPKGMLEQSYVLEGEVPAKDTSLIISEFNRLTQELSGVYGLYVANLNTDATYGINEGEEFEAASLMKLPVMAMMYSMHENGDIDLDDVYSLKDTDRVGGSGSIVYQPTGTEYSYRELVDYMGQQSDNTALRACLNLLGEGNVENYIQSIGMTNTSFADNSTTPRDIGLFFKKLWTAKLVEKKNRDAILKSLTDTIYEDWIPLGIPEVRVAHKFGREVHVVNDAGIVFGSDPFVLVIMSKGVLEKEADEFIPAMASVVYNFEAR